MDEKKFKKKYYVGILSSPLTLFPVVGGVTSGFILGTFVSIPAGLFCLAAGSLLSLGVLSQRLLCGSEKIYRQARKEVEEEVSVTRQKRLDILDEKLVRDRDPRTQEALRDLRALVKAIKQDENWQERINVQSSFEIVCIVGDIFDRCVNALERTLKLYETSKSVASDKVKRSFSKKRDDIICNVQGSVDQLSKTFEEIQELSLSEDPSAALPGLNMKLVNQLEIMKKVDERMNREFGNGSYESTRNESL